MWLWPVLFEIQAWAARLLKFSSQLISLQCCSSWPLLFCKGTRVRLLWAGSSLISSHPILPQTPPIRNTLVIYSDHICCQGGVSFWYVRKVGMVHARHFCLWWKQRSGEKLGSSLPYLDGLVLVIYHVYKCTVYMVMNTLLLHEIVFFWFLNAKSGNKHW